MSNVLEFRPASTGGPVPVHSSQGGGEVIIFPGVRYERTAEIAPSPSPKRTGGRSSRRGGAKSR